MWLRDVSRSLPVALMTMKDLMSIPTTNDLMR